MRRRLPVVPSLQQQKTLAKTLRKHWRDAAPDAFQRIRESHPKLLEATDDEIARVSFKLSDAQLVIAREYGLASWQKLVDRIAKRRPAVGLSSKEKARLLIEDPFLVTHGCHDSFSKEVWPLIVAAMAGNTKSLESLLDADSSLVNAEFFGCSPIVFATQEGHTRTVQVLLERGARPTATSWFGKDTILKLAEDRGHQETASAIRRAVAQLHRYDEGSERFHDAVAQADSVRLAELLAAHPELVDQSDRQGISPLHKAVVNRDVELIELLIDRGADLNQADGKARMRPIDHAIWNDIYIHGSEDMELVDLLLSKGAEYTIEVAVARNDIERVKAMVSANPDLVNYESPMGMTPKAAAAQHGYLEMLRFLIDNGADATRREGRWGFALWAAVWYDHYDVAELLLQHGADPNAEGQDSHGTATSAATATRNRAQGKNRKMLELLYRYGGEGQDWTYTERLQQMFERNPNDPLMSELFVRIRDDAELLDRLLELGIPMPSTVTVCQGNLWKGDIAIFRTLLERGLDPNLPNFLRIAPLHRLAASRHNCNPEGRDEDEDENMKRAELALEFGADIDAIELHHDATPLGWAARFGSCKMAEFLLEKGADPNLAGAPWAQPVAVAARAGHDEIVELLKRHGALTPWAN